jgi:hypothetical protein
MRGVKDFLKDSLPAMVDYILVVSTPAGDAYGSYPGTGTDQHDRLNIANTLRQRALTMPVLDRETIPILPYLLDIPRHLAIITSAVIRNSRDYHTKPKSQEPGDRALDELCAKCFEVEGHALQRVSQLATRISSDRRWPSTSAGPTQVSSPPVSAQSRPDHSPTSPLSISSTGQRRARKLTRPSTAPSASDTDLSRRNMLSDVSTPSSPSRLFTRDTQPTTNTTTQPSSPEGERGTWSRRRHRQLPLKSPSTDSIPSYGINGVSSPLARPLRLADPSTDISDDGGKRKRGLLRGILRR